MVLHLTYDDTGSHPDPDGESDYFAPVERKSEQSILELRWN